MSAVSVSEPPELCPFDDRQRPREMYVKLVVVHITVIAAYAHLVHLRRESRAPLYYASVIAWPLGITISTVMPLFGLLAELCIALWTWRKQRLLLALSIMLGRLPQEDHDQAYYEDEAVTWPPRLTSETAREFAVSACLMTQCVTSLWLFSRRINRGSDALYGQRIAQLAVLGLSTSVMGMLHALLRPRVGPGMLEFPQWWIFFRPCIVDLPQRHYDSPLWGNVGVYVLDISCAGYIMCYRRLRGDRA